MRPRASLSRWLPLALQLTAVLVLTVGGCQAPGPTAKEESQQSWNDQRAALKFELASAELETGRVNKALTLAQEAVGLSPEQPGHAALLARVYLARGDFAAARRVLARVCASHPDFGEASYLLGAVCEREQRWEDAIGAYGRAVEAQPDELDYRVALAQAVAESGNHEAARRIE